MVLGAECDVRLLANNGSKILSWVHNVSKFIQTPAADLTCKLACLLFANYLQLLQS